MTPHDDLIDEGMEERAQHLAIILKRCTPMEVHEIDALRFEMQTALHEEASMTDGEREGLTLVLRLLATIDCMNDKVSIAVP